MKDTSEQYNEIKNLRDKLHIRDEVIVQKEQRINQKDQRIEQLENQLKQARQHHFGTSSEKLSPD